ncbi:TPA: flavodoxin [Proteus mirabilis]|uniref:Flavodoxin n=5 Tax=Enterobacterales TaxID=91347 RepID=A0A7D5W9G7_PROMI|nr:flavodoxin [Proteus mirabilis]MBA7798139.1 flavodoxin [Citrobacter sp. RHBSTW-01065]EHZ6745404.1 flavodoxin [Proteus mirabilis]EIM6940311.1 flavodoxin [Proteus mirabilis]EIO2231621.1 flavodoxin [Proteus mirabilis]EJD6334067.1 flavodoxin [Proteus mirabilis]
MMNIGIFVGTVYGNALAVAEEAQRILLEHKYQANIYEEGTLADWQKYSTVLVISSTTGQGDLPDTIAPLFYELRDNVGYQPNLHYGLIALGDSSYDNFCGAGMQFEALLQEHQAKRIGEILKIDSMDIAEPEVFAINWLENWATLLN